MTLTVHLDREKACLTARILQGSKFGEDLLAGQRMKDPECAMGFVQTRLEDKFRGPVTIQWVTLENPCQSVSGA